jgi:hypothetical protein
VIPEPAHSKGVSPLQGWGFIVTPTWALLARLAAAQAITLRAFSPNKEFQISNDEYSKFQIPNSKLDSFGI